MGALRNRACTREPSGVARPPLATFVDPKAERTDAFDHVENRLPLKQTVPSALDPPKKLHVRRTGHAAIGRDRPKERPTERSVDRSVGTSTV
jgi:hypothetical protein